jgi:hypothetical protein
MAAAKLPPVAGFWQLLDWQETNVFALAMIA